MVVCACGYTGCFDCFQIHLPVYMHTYIRVCRRARALPSPALFLVRNRPHTLSRCLERSAVGLVHTYVTARRALRPGRHWVSPELKESDALHMACVRAQIAVRQIDGDTRSTPDRVAEARGTYAQTTASQLSSASSPDTASLSTPRRSGHVGSCLTNHPRPIVTRADREKSTPDRQRRGRGGGSHCSSLAGPAIMV